MNIFASDIQIAIFASNLDLSNKAELANSIIKNSSNLLNGEQVILPLPSDAPQEIPRIILNNSNSSFVLQIAANRLDFFYHDREMKDRIPTKKLEDLTSDVNEKLKVIIKAIDSSTQGLHVSRLGFIPTLIIPLGEKELATKNLIKNYFNVNKVKDDISELNFSYNRREKLSSYEVNLGVRIGAFKKRDDPLNNKVILVNFDINTPAEVLLSTKVVEVEKFSQEAFKFIKDNIKDYL